MRLICGCCRVQVSVHACQLSELNMRWVISQPACLVMDPSSDFVVLIETALHDSEDQQQCLD